jgi:hypothetical protein
MNVDSIDRESPEIIKRRCCMKLYKAMVFMLIAALSNTVTMGMDAPDKPITLEEKIAGLPKDMNLEVALSLIITWARDFPRSEAIKKINTIIINNPELEQKINEPAFCLRLIKTLANKSHISQRQAALSLGTQEAKNRVQIQDEFNMFILNSEEFDDDVFDKKCNEFIQNGIDFNFTYVAHYIYNTDSGPKTVGIVTPVLHELVFNGPESLRAITFILKNGANINDIDSRGDTPLMLYCQETPYVFNDLPDSNSLALLDVLLATPNIEVNKINAQVNKVNGLLFSNTALSYLLNNRYWVRNNMSLHNNLIIAVQKMLDADADPKLVDENIMSDFLGLVISGTEIDIALRKRIEDLLNK